MFSVFLWVEKQWGLGFWWITDIIAAENGVHLDVASGCSGKKYKEAGLDFFSPAGRAERLT